MFERIAPWVTRFVLLAVTFIFAGIGLKFITDPVHAAGASGIAATSATAVTAIRVGFGGFPLGSAVVALYCLVSKRRVLAGLCLAAMMIGVVLSVRFFAVLTDGTAMENMRLLTAEGVVLAAAIGGILIEARYRRARPAHPA